MSKLLKISSKAAMVFLLAALLLGGAGCSSSRRAIGSDISTTTAAGTSVKERYAAFTDNCGDWRELNAPIKIELLSPEKISGSGKVFMRRGKDIYISVRILGIEAAVVYVDADSVYVQDKYHKQYLAESIHSILKGADLSISDIQDLLLGRIFADSSAKGALAPGKMSLDKNGSTWTVLPKNKNKYAACEMAYSCSDNLPQTFTVTIADTGSKVTCDYSSPSFTTKGVFMDQSQFRGTASDTKIDVKVKISMSKAKWSVSNSVRWKTPTNYKRISITTLTKMLGDF